jgi:hypothetical protein
MSELHFTLLGDGPSDVCLLRPLRWLVQQHVSDQLVVQADWADLSSFRDPPRGLAQRIQTAIEFYPCDLLFVHRDAEREPAARRYAEIAEALLSLTATPTAWIGVVPIRMTEAWLLIDEQAIRTAADNPRGTEDLSLPSLGSLEDVPDPKSLLYDCLRKATELSGRRLHKFRVQQAARRVADYVDDFSPCRRLTAFARLENDIKSALTQCGWNCDG